MSVKNILEKYDIVNEERDFYDDLVNESIEVKSDNANIDTASQVRLHHRDANSLIDLSDSYLQFDIEHQGTDNADKQLLRLNPQGGAMSMWSRAVLRINNMIVETVDYANFVAMVKNNLIYSKDYLETEGENMGVKKLDVVRAEAVAVASARKAYFVPMHAVFGFCTVNKVVSGEITVELTRGSKLQYAIEQTKDTAISGTADLLVKKCSMWLNRVRPHPVVDSKLKSLMSSNVSSSFVFPSYSAYYTAALGVSSQRILTSSERILHAFVVCLDPDYKGHLQSSTDLGQLSLRLNGTASPTIGYTELGSTGKGRSYAALFRLLSNGDYGMGIGLSRKEYDDLTIIPFDFRGTPQNLTGSPSVLELEVTQIANDRRFVVVVQTEKKVEINYSGGQAVVRVH